MTIFSGLRLNRPIRTWEQSGMEMLNCQVHHSLLWQRNIRRLSEYDLAGD